MSTMDEYSSTIARLDRLESSIENVSSSVDEMWVLVTAVFAVLSQFGFAAIEAGWISSKHGIVVFYKHGVVLITTLIGFWLVGFAFAYGRDYRGLIGRNKFALQHKDFTSIVDDESNESVTDDLDFHTFFQQWSYAATVSAIVGGSVAGRCSVMGHIVYALLVGAVAFPCAAHVCWADGWLSPTGPDPDKYLVYGNNSNNFIDFAGSGIIHIVGGAIGIVGAALLGPRPVGSAHTLWC